MAGMLGTVPHAVGVNNHQGSRATSDVALMQALMPVLRERGLFFIDSRTEAKTVAYDIAKRDGVRAASRKVFLDGVVARGGHHCATRTRGPRCCARRNYDRDRPSASGNDSRCARITATGSARDPLRIREEAQRMPLADAVSRALRVTGTTVTSAGLVLAGTFGVLAVVGSGSAGTQNVRTIVDVGVGLALGVLMDTFLVRTLLVPSAVVLIGRWNWWPSRLSRTSSR